MDKEHYVVEQKSGVIPEWKLVAFWNAEEGLEKPLKFFDEAVTDGYPTRLLRVRQILLKEVP